MKDTILIKITKHVKNARLIIALPAIALIIVWNVMSISFGIVRKENVKFIVLPLVF